MIKKNQAKFSQPICKNDNVNYPLVSTAKRFHIHYCGEGYLPVHFGHTMNFITNSEEQIHHLCGLIFGPATLIRLVFVKYHQIITTKLVGGLCVFGSQSQPPTLYLYHNYLSVFNTTSNFF